MGNVAVIGAGASGMAAAINAAKYGARVTLIEKNKKPGCKLLLTGNGRCNLTNLDQDLRHFHSSFQNEKTAWFMASVPGDVDFPSSTDFFEGLGLLLRCRDGYVYPLSNQSSSVLYALTAEMKRLGIKTAYNTPVSEIRKEAKGAAYSFDIVTDGWTYKADAVVIAAGSMAAPRTGSSGDSYRLAESFGLSVKKPLPALVPLYSRDAFLEKLSGVRMQAGVRIYADGEPVGEDVGEVQFIKNGISGIPVFQVSRYAVKALDEGRDTKAVLNLIPEGAALFHGDGLDGGRAAYAMAGKCGWKSSLQFLEGLFPEKMALAILKILGIPKDKKVSRWSTAELEKAAGLIDAFQVSLCGHGGFEAAQVCQGGVDIDEIDPHTMGAAFVDGLYFAGEAVDIDGDCGGYNLEWAWKSGLTAGRSAAKYACGQGAEPDDLWREASG